mgnify:FL=1|tara:strand:+ start:401 stop:928 length:528 start_codon:yes stop_codon:yes gene_type:complete
MQNNIQKIFTALPIPGEGIIAEKGQYAWQRPPALDTVEEAISYYVNRFSDETLADGIAALLDNGQSVNTLMQAFIDKSIYDGIHSIDVGFLISPVVVELISLIGDKNDVKYVTGFEKSKDNPIIDSLIIAKIEDEIINSKPKEEKEVEEVLETSDLNIPTQPRGIMSRTMQEEIQ